MLNKQMTPLISESTVSNQLISQIDNEKYSKVFKGFCHAVLIPLLLIFIFSLKISLIYFGTMVILYSTIFRSNAQSFFGSFMVAILIVLAFIIPS